MANTCLGDKCPHIDFLGEAAINGPMAAMEAIEDSQRLCQGIGQCMLEGSFETNLGILEGTYAESE